MYVRILTVLLAMMMSIWLPLEAADVLYRQNGLQKRLSETKAPITSAEVIHVYPHDTAAFTQGLFFHKGELYESTGLYGKSALLQKEARTGKIVREIRMISATFRGRGCSF